MTDSGYLLYTTPHTFFYIDQFETAGSFVMVFRCAYGFGIIVIFFFFVTVFDF